MADGFRAVFDDLHRTAGKIEEVVQAVGGLSWQGPSGNYGHPGVQAGWTQFIEDAKAQIEKLVDKAGDHSDGLRDAAGRYQESDDETGFVLGNIGALLDPSGGTGTDAATGAAGFMSPERAAHLFPDGGIANRLDSEGSLY